MTTAPEERSACAAAASTEAAAGCGGAGATRRSEGGEEASPLLPQTCDVLKIRTEVFGRFRLLGALAGPWDRQKTIQDEKPVLGKGSGLPGTAH